MEELLKLAVNYGLGIFFSIAISITFFCHLRDEKRLSISREERLMKFIEEHSLVTQKLMEQNIEKQETIAKYQREEHNAIIGTLGLIKDAINSLNLNWIKQNH